MYTRIGLCSYPCFNSSSSKCACLHAKCRSGPEQISDVWFFPGLSGCSDDHSQILLLNDTKLKLSKSNKELKDTKNEKKVSPQQCAYLTIKSFIFEGSEQRSFPKHWKTSNTCFFQRELICTFCFGLAKRFIGKNSARARLMEI